jgi:hypothetical protein
LLGESGLSASFIGLLAVCLYSLFDLEKVRKKLEKKKKKKK